MCFYLHVGFNIILSQNRHQKVNNSFFFFKNHWNNTNCCSSEILLTLLLYSKLLYEISFIVDVNRNVRTRYVSYKNIF